VNCEVPTSGISDSTINLECHLTHVPAANTVTVLLLSSFWRRFGRLLQSTLSTST